METKPKKKTSFGTTMGVTSIIAILVILVLVVFSALSITTSKADLVLSQKTSDSAHAFYAADATAEEKLAEIAAAVKEGSGWESKMSALGCEVDGNMISYVVPVDVNRNLEVMIRVASNGNISRELWQVVPASEWVADDTINLYIPKQG